MLTARQYKKLNANHDTGRPEALYEFEQFVRELIIEQFGDWDIDSVDDWEKDGKVIRDMEVTVDLRHSKAGVHKLWVQYSGKNVEDLGVDDWGYSEFLHKV